ncbi:HEAT repeat domain-containing protein [Halosimplex halophilum]|uniref:HEAT repeat domain-containing protein n=1 Tax=Halosimplex halophilum TaxID=2559572 RepID=UPI00107FB860|nr:HEAT repeat domain-containing protein [Halosimplex halophilum]
MDGDSSAADRVVEAIESGATGEARAALDDLAAAPADARKDAVRELRAVADEAPALFDGVATALTPFLTDDERSVRLTTAKLFVAVADGEPEAVIPAVEALADRLADDGEFYYVRARAAEGLGYVALDHPDAVASPDVLADLRVGLTFDEPEVSEKLAKALAFVALGDPDRLRHLVDRLAEHLDDDSEFVRFHVCTALAAVGSAHPGRLAEAVDPLVARLDDGNPHVRGRAAEALAAPARAGPDPALPVDRVAELTDSDEAFVADRARLLSARLDGDGSRTDDGDRSTEDEAERAPLGSLESIRRSTERAVEAMRSPDAEGECPHCGLALRDTGPPMCPRCGAPR